MTLAETLDRYRRALAAAGVDAPHEAEILVAAAAGIPRARLFLERDRDAGDIRGVLDGWLARRAAGEPVQYILGAWDFYGREFRLTRDTLIPRPETEGLVERAIEGWRHAGRRGGRILDVGTGSGAIAVTLAAELPEATVVATDVSVGALRIARENAARHGVGDRVSFVASDGYCALKSAGAFALVVSNPPYVAESERETLPAEVLRHEPERALFSGADGLDLIRRLVSLGDRHLIPGGELWCEIGERQGGAVSRLPAGALRFLGVFEDLAGRDRVAGWRNQPT
jgi:release factor glutamine methyltransferase